MTRENYGHCTSCCITTFAKRKHGLLIISYVLLTQKAYILRISSSTHSCNEYLLGASNAATAAKFALKMISQYLPNEPDISAFLQIFLFKTVDRPAHRSWPRTNITNYLDLDTSESLRSQSMLSRGRLSFLAKRTAQYLKKQPHNSKIVTFVNFRSLCSSFVRQSSRKECI